MIIRMRHLMIIRTKHYNDHKDEAALESIVKMIISINHKDDHKDEFSKFSKITITY